MDIKNHNVSFNGKLYSKIGNHLTKPIYCCHHGDKKFIRYINEIALKSSDTFNLKVNSNIDKTLEVSTKEIPELSLFEKISFIVTPIQNKALRMRKEGRIENFTYKISEAEYQNIKKSAGSKLRNELKIFENNLRQKLSGDDLLSLNKIIY